MRFPGPLNLCHRSFVDHYYATRDSCKLYLYVSDDGKVLGTLGRELASFAHNSDRITLRIGTNWYSLQKGVGGELSDYSARVNPGSTGLMFGGSQNTLDILHHRDWIFAPGICRYALNEPCTVYASDSRFRAGVKRVVRSVVQKKISSFAANLNASWAAHITVREEDAYSDDLIPRRSAFSFRLAPTSEYLSWRYGLSLSFVRYRLFRLMNAGASSGYIILNDSPTRILVAQCDGDDPSTLAYGVLLSVLEAAKNDSAPRPAFLTCCHPAMQAIFRQFGFREQDKGFPFAFRSQPPGFTLPLDTSNWLINFDWGDNGVRPPYLGRST